FYFFQAEDGIRDRTVTGVQTCALPIYDGCTILRLRPRIIEVELRSGTESLSNQKLRGVIPGRHQRAPRIQIRVLVVEERKGSELTASGSRSAGNVQPEKRGRIIRPGSCWTVRIVI